MVYEVRILLKDGLLDPAAVTIERALQRLHFDEVTSFKTGKTFIIEVTDGTPRSRIEEMCSELLANPVMERFEITEAKS